MTKENNNLLDMPMKEVFEWSKKSETVRANLWEYFLELSGKDPIRAENKMGHFIIQKNPEIIKYIEENLKK